MMLRTYFGSMHRSNTSVLTFYDYLSCLGYEPGKNIWAVCTLLIFAVGFPATVAILWEMFRRRGRPISPNDFFILNLSVMDAVFLAFIPPGMLNHFIFNNRWFDNVWNGAYTLNIWGRPLLMACVCLDCYLAVLHPITYRTRKSLMPRVVMAAIVWTLTVASGIVFITNPNVFLTVFVIGPFIVAIVIIGLCDYFILHTLIKSEEGKKNIHPQKQRAIHTLIDSLVITLISYLPPVLMYALGLSLVSDPVILLCCVSIPANITSTLGSAVMPLLYLHNLGKLDYFRCGCCRKS